MLNYEKISFGDLTLREFWKLLKGSIKITFGFGIIVGIIELIRLVFEAGDSKKSIIPEAIVSLWSQLPWSVIIILALVIILLFIPRTLSGLFEEIGEGLRNHGKFLKRAPFLIRFLTFVIFSSYIICFEILGIWGFLPVMFIASLVGGYLELISQKPGYSDREDLE